MARRPLHALIVSLALFAFWVILSGKLDATHLIMGAVSAIFVTWLSGERLYTRTDDGGRQWLSFLPWGRLLLYAPWLAWEIAKANIQVLKLVFSPISKLQPRQVRYRPELKSEVSRVVLGNSITLTPGTVTLDLTPDGEYLIHALDPSGAEGVQSGSMARKVAWTFKEEASR